MSKNTLKLDPQHLLNTAELQEWSLQSLIVPPTNLRVAWSLSTVSYLQVSPVWTWFASYTVIYIYIYSYAMLYSHTPCTCILVAVLRCFKKHPDNSWLSPISVLFLEICSGERLLSRKWRGVATWAERPQKLRVCKTHQNTSKHRCFDLVGQPFSQVRFCGF